MSTTTTKVESGTGGSNRRREARPAGGGLLSGQRRPGAPQRGRNRSWGLVVLAALLVLGAGLAVAAWGLSAGDKESVLAVGSTVAKGQVIEREDLVSVSVSGVGDAFDAAQIDTVIGQTAAVDLVAGQIITGPTLTAEATPGAGQSLIGLSLDPTRVPGSGLEPGDLAEVIAVPGANDDNTGTNPDDVDEALDTPQVLANGAEIYDVAGDPSAGGQVLVTLIVEDDDARRIAAYSTQNRVAVVEISSSSPAASALSGGS